MPIGLGLCTSHAPSLFQYTYEGWERIHHRLNDGHPQPPETALETPEVVADRAQRSKANFARLKREILAYRPDAIVYVFGDQREWFDGADTAQVMVYTGPDTWTTHNTGLADGLVDQSMSPPPEDHRFPVRVDRQLSDSLLRGLVDRGFDVAFASEVSLQSRPDRGIPHGYGHIAYHLQDLSTPVVLVLVNTYDGPPAIMPGPRNFELGAAIAEVCAGSPKRIAIVGSGGMSHMPRGLRSGWVDEPLDNWFLDRMAAGDLQKLSSPFTFRSEMTIAGFGELRCWLVVAGAVDRIKPGHKAVKVDYFPARKVTTGSGWAYWPPVETVAKRELART